EREQSAPDSGASDDLVTVVNTRHNAVGLPFDSHARFFAPAAHATGDRILLPGDEAEHLTRVLRLSTGATVCVFNGRGAEFEAIVETIDREGVRVHVGAPSTPAPEPRIAITLAQAVLKGDKMDDVVRDAVMLGVAAIQPLVTARSEI